MNTARKSLIAFSALLVVGGLVAGVIGITAFSDTEEQRAQAVQTQEGTGDSDLPPAYYDWEKGVCVCSDGGTVITSNPDACNDGALCAVAFDPGLDTRPSAVKIRTSLFRKIGSFFREIFTRQEVANEQIQIDETLLNRVDRQQNVDSAAGSRRSSCSAGDPPSVAIYDPPAGASFQPGDALVVRWESCNVPTGFNTQPTVKARVFLQHVDTQERIPVSFNPLTDYTSNRGYGGIVIPTSTTHGAYRPFVEVIWAGQPPINGSNTTPQSYTYYVGDPLETQTIALDAGWNMISSYIDPGVVDINTLFVDIVNDIEIIKNGAGQSAIPSLGVNTIGTWNPLEGYRVKVTQPTQLVIEGTKIDPQSTSLSLPAGWSIVSYLRDSNMAMPNALANIVPNLLIAKDISGDTFIPSFGVNGIGDMEVGQGYQVNLSAPTTLVYPAN